VKNQSIIFLLFRGSVLPVLLVAIGASVSCMQTYDAQGRPMQTVDPGVAVAGAAAAGLVGYAIANDNNHHHNNYYYGHGGYYHHR
jgi:hypothetical protein